MRIAILGAGNSGLAMAAHLSYNKNKVSLWNRSTENISNLINSKIVHCSGYINGSIKIFDVTDQLDNCVRNAEIIFVTTPATAHKSLAQLLSKLGIELPPIVLCPGRTFGALEFQRELTNNEYEYSIDIAETQTILYTCRKINENTVNIISLKEEVLIATLDNYYDVLLKLPKCIRTKFKKAQSIIETSIGNVGMILHCAPLLLNTGWVESQDNNFKYYYDGITPSIGRLIEKIDKERVAVAAALHCRIPTTVEWFESTYGIKCTNVYECIRTNLAYKTIDAPITIYHRYILEDIPCGLVPLEHLGIELGLDMMYTTQIINLGCILLDIDLRIVGRKFDRDVLMSIGGLSNE